MELLIVLGRVFSSAAANVFQKKFTHKGLHSLFIVMLSYLVLACISLPLLILVEYNAIDHSFWINILLAALLDMVLAGAQVWEHTITKFGSGVAWRASIVPVQLYT